MLDDEHFEGSLATTSRSTGAGVPLAALRGGQRHAAEQHRQLRGVDLDRGRTIRGRDHLEAAEFQTLELGITIPSLWVR